MRGLFILPLLLIPLAFAQNQTLIISQEKPDLAVLTHKWSKTRRVTAKAITNDPPPPAPSMATSASRTAQRSDRLNESGGPRDPNPYSIEARSAALEKIVRESRTPPPKTLDGFTYLLKLKNDSSKKIEVVFWEYQFIEATNLANITRRQFLCGLNLKAGKEKEVTAFSLSGPSKVVSAESLADKNKTPLQEKVLINRVEFEDGTIWQRKDWSFGEIRLSYVNAMSTPWTEMCRSL